MANYEHYKSIFGKRSHIDKNRIYYIISSLYIIFSSYHILMLNQSNCLSLNGGGFLGFKHKN